MHTTYKSLLLFLIKNSRFLINLSSEEKRDSIKLCSYIELAHWYYLDLMRPEDPSLPACNLKEFMRTCQ